MATNLHNLSEYDIQSVPNAKGMRFGIVVSEWNHSITGALLEGAQQTLLKHGVEENDLIIMTVPGSFELVFGAAQMAKSGKVDGVIAIGCVIRGDTPHFDYICEAELPDLCPVGSNPLQVGQMAYDAIIVPQLTRVGCCVQTCLCKLSH